MNWCHKITAPKILKKKKNIACGLFQRPAGEMKKEQLNLDMSNFSKYWVVFMMEHKFKFRYEKHRNKINWIVFLKKTLKEIVFKTKRRIRLLYSPLWSSWRSEPKCLQSSMSTSACFVFSLLENSPQDLI